MEANGGHLVTEVLKEGDGAEVKKAELLTANYLGQIWRDGKVFDNSYDRGEPATFVLGQLVPGWQEGITLMPVGSKYRFWIPSKLAYGEQGAGPIGPNSTLVFEVELLGIEPPPPAPAAAPEAPPENESEK